MKIHSWFFLVIAILMWNVFLIQRDQKLFEAYNAACAQQSHPNCNYAK